MNRLEGAQYVRLRAGAAEAVAPYLGVPAAEIGELVLDLDAWPEEIQPSPLRARDGRLLAGDPVLVDAGDEGLLFLSRDCPGTCRTVLVDWAQVRTVEVLRGLPTPA